MALGCWSIGESSVTRKAHSFQEERRKGLVRVDLLRLELAVFLETFGLLALFEFCRIAESCFKAFL